MNTIKLYDSAETLKYTFTPKNIENSDGTIEKCSASFYTNEIGAELIAGEIGISIDTAQSLDIELKQDIIKAFKNDELLGTFIVYTFDKTAERKYTISGYDYIGRLEDDNGYGTHAPQGTTLGDIFADGIGGTVDIPVSLSSAAAALPVSGDIPPGFNTRELLQHLMLSLPISLSAFGSCGIDITVLPAINAESEVKNINAGEIKSSAKVTRVNTDIGIINIKKNESRFSDDMAYYIQGYVPVGESTATRFNDIINADIGGITINYEHIDDIEYLPKNEYKYPAFSNTIRPFSQLDGFLPDYYTIRLMTNGNIAVTVNQAALDAFITANPRYAECKKTVGGITYGFIWISANEYFNTTVSASSSAVLDPALPTFDVNTYFDVDSEAISRITNYLSRNTRIEFEKQWNGEKPYDLLSLPAVWGETHYIRIDHIELNIGAVNIFAKVSGIALSRAEEENLT